MRYKVLILTLAIIMVSSVALFAQIIVPPIQGPIIDKISIFIPDLTGSTLGTGDRRATEFVQVLRNDLINTGLFDVGGGGGVGLDSFGNINFQAFFNAGGEALVKGEYQSIGDTIKIDVRLFDIAREKALLGRSYEATSGKVREAAHRFAGLVMKQLTGLDGFFTSKIVFVSGANQNRDLYIMDYDGYAIRKLTNHRALLLSPNCSSNGTKIVFNSDKVWDQDLYVLNLVPSVKETRLTRGFRLDQSAEWSPDGSKLAYSSNGDIFVANASGKGAVNITGTRAIEVSPTWSPNGRQIAFVSDRSGSPQVYVMNSDGTNVRKISTGSYNTDPSWSPNIGINRIAYVRVEGSEANIFTVNPDGSDEQRLTWSSGRNENPSWSPDGHYISFSSSRSGAKEIYIMYLNGQNQLQLTRGGGKTFPTWCK
ncbi:MAG: PD40 domain-containing protein [Deltaproteobacteria bacterium]|nr:PD40 domain-containing protein [Deltaproteobacteria bacterium]